jgi:hypothetical protein
MSQDLYPFICSKCGRELNGCWYVDGVFRYCEGCAEKVRGLKQKGARAADDDSRHRR